MIIQKVITTPKAEILVIGGLPEDATIGLIKHGGLVYRNPVLIGEPLRNIIDLPSGKWQPLGFLKDISEGVAKGLVEELTVNYAGIGIRKYYENYLKKHPSCDRATESLHSLIESNCKLKNKYGETMPEYEDFGSFSRFHEMFCLWKAEQSYVFTNSFLLKKI